MTQPDRIRLESALWRADVVPAWGAAMTLLQVQHEGTWRDVGRPATAEARATADRLGMTAWPLLPYSNRIPGGSLRAHFDGRSEVFQLPPTDCRFAMPIHGTGWLREWHVESADPLHCSLSLAEPASVHWPWSFHAEQRVSLKDNCLRVDLSIRNESEDDMPCGLGWHPYFVRTPRTTLRARFGWRDDSDPETTEFRSVRRDTAEQWNGRQDVLLSTLAPLDHCFGGWTGQARLRWPEWNLMMDLETGGNLMRHCVLFCPPDAPFLCVEPVSHANYALGASPENALRDGVVRLAPGETLQRDIHLTVAALDSERSAAR